MPGIARRDALSRANADNASSSAHMSSVLMRSRARHPLSGTPKAYHNKAQRASQRTLGKRWTCFPFPKPHRGFTCRVHVVKPLWGFRMKIYRIAHPGRARGDPGPRRKRLRRFRVVRRRGDFRSVRSRQERFRYAESLPQPSPGRSAPWDRSSHHVGSKPQRGFTSPARMRQSHT